jgi:hypothetical protein
VHTPQIPYYSQADLKRAAGLFLERHHASCAIPVPIEEIVDNGFRIDVVPCPGLQATYDAVGFTTGDLSAIYVDDFVYENRPTRYRFTLAHEIGHVFLHADFYRAHQWKDLKEWKA